MDREWERPVAVAQTPKGPNHQMAKGGGKEVKEEEFIQTRSTERAGGVDQRRAYATLWWRRSLFRIVRYARARRDH